MSKHRPTGSRVKHPTLLLVAQPHSYRIAPYLAAAQKMGLKVLIASQGKHSLISEVQQGLHIDPDNINNAVAEINRQQHFFVGVLACDDSTMEVAAAIAKALKLPHNPPAAARVTRRKDLARTLLKKHHCPLPDFYLLDIRKDLQKQIREDFFPCVVKPLHLSASTGVIRANTSGELLAACQRTAAIITAQGKRFEHHHLLVERYIDGEEIALEGYLQQGKLHILAIFDKPVPLNGPFFEESIYVTPSRLSKARQQAVIDAVNCACQAYGLTTGPIHAELRINRQQAWILEVANRTIGGDCARTLDSGQGFTLEELTIALACRLPFKPKPQQKAKGVMMLPIEQSGILRRVEGIKAASQQKYINKVDILIQPGNRLTPLPEGSQYLGYIFAEADTPEQVTQALQNAWKKLKVVVAKDFIVKSL